MTLTRKQIEELLTLAKAATQETWVDTLFLTQDGKREHTAEDAGESARLSFSKSKSPYLHGVTIADDGAVIAYVGNGPTSEANSTFIAAANPTVLSALCTMALNGLEVQPRPMSEEPRTGLLCLFHMPRFNEWHIGRWFPADKSDKDDADGFVTGATTKILASLCDGWLPLTSLPEPKI